MPQPDLQYILGYGSSGWLLGHLRAGEIGNASCGGAVRHRYHAHWRGGGQKMPTPPVFRG